MKTANAIETVYRGFRFRSRLEARWAIFFDVMGEAWEYEKEGYNLSGVYYLPDFYLPRIGVFVEIKGQKPDSTERIKVERLRDASGRASMIFHGLPLENWGELYCWDSTDGSAGTSNYLVQWCDNDWGYLNFCSDDSSMSRTYFMDEFMSEWGPQIGYPYAGKTTYAADCAKSARFEHGENKDYREARPTPTESEDDLPW